MLTWIVIVLGAAFAAYLVALFNSLVKSRQLAEEGWSGIDVQLKRRADLVPNLVETVSGYAGHERALFDEIARLRTQVGRLADSDVAGRGQLEGALSAALTKLVALAEAVSWVGLLLGMYFKYLGTPQTEIGVKIFGPLHGGIFVAFLVVALFAGIAYKWSPLTYVWALLASIVPLATVIFVIWADRTAKLGTPTRTSDPTPAGRPVPEAT